MSAALADAVRLGFELNPLQLAYHEAGHAVIGHGLGRQVTAVSIDRTHGGGLTQSLGLLNPLVVLLLSLAGTRAERLAPGFLPHLVGAGALTDERDRDVALEMASSDPHLRAWMREDATRQVDEALAERRSVLDRLARRLLEQRHLDALDIRRILDSDARC